MKLHLLDIALEIERYRAGMGHRVIKNVGGTLIVIKLLEGTQGIETATGKDIAGMICEFWRKTANPTVIKRMVKANISTCLMLPVNSQNHRNKWGTL